MKAKIWWRGAKYLGFCFLAIAAIEAVFGAWLSPNYVNLEIWRDELRYYDVKDFHSSFGMTTFRTDEHGFRGAYGTPSDIELLVIGNGTTIEQYVSEGETWADYLRQNFADAGRKTAIAAAGYHGQTTRGLIRRFDLWFPLVPGLRPRVILAYIGSNEDGLEVATHYDAMVSPKRSKRLRHYFKNNSFFYGLANRLRRKFRSKTPTKVGADNALSPRRWRPIAFPSEAEIKRSQARPILVNYRSRVTQLIGRIREFGAVPVIVNQHFGRYRIIGGKLHESGTGTGAQGDYFKARMLGDAAMTACRAGGAICIDMVREMGFSGDGDFYDHVHTGPSGNRRIAKFLYRRLKDVIGSKSRR
jgi:hypothetical protein